MSEPPSPGDEAGHRNGWATLPRQTRTALARSAAIRRLVAAHADEYDRYSQEERIKRELPPRPANADAKALQREVRELRARIAELEGNR